MILAIDPGPFESAWVEYDPGSPLEGVWPSPVSFAKQANVEVLRRILETSADVLAIEKIVSYGRPVGQETFATCVWSGRFEQHWHDRQAMHPAWTLDGPVVHVTRLQVKQCICKSGQAKDGAVRQALIDLWGGVEGKDKAIGRKASPGPLYGVFGDVWQALAVAVTVDETEFFVGASA